MSECFFKHYSKCRKESDKELITAGSKRIQTIINSSKLRKDTIHVYLEDHLESNPEFKIQCHKDCVCTYTSKTHIKRSQSDSASVSCSTLPKRTRRCSTPNFDFKQNCLFCGELCQLHPDPKNPNRWRKVARCATADEGPHDFKNAILEVCEQRQDDQADEVRIRIQGAVSDLHAADAIYHKDCCSKFMSERNVEYAKKKAHLKKDTQDEAYNLVISDIKSNQSHIWNTKEIYEKYVSYGGSRYSRRILISNIQEYFGEDIVLLSGNGVASLLVFRTQASSSIRLVDDESDDIDMAIKMVASKINVESKTMKRNIWTYETDINLQDTLSQVSDTFLDLLKAVSPKLENTLPAALIGNIITSIINNQATTLQIALAVSLRDKSLVQQMHDYRICCSYDELIRFKASAAHAASQQNNLQGLMDSDAGLVQVVVDNFDANIASQNGLRSTHALALLVTQSPENPIRYEPSSDTPYCISRLRKEELVNEPEKPLAIQRYNGPKKPEMTDVKKDMVLSLSELARRQVSLNRARDLEHEFFSMIVQSDQTPEHGGFNTKLAREQGHTQKPATIAVYTPLIDMSPSDPDTIMTAMVEAMRLTEETGQIYTILTADQALYRIIVDITWVYPDMFSTLIPRLGGMHLLMSFIGCVGVLMANSGIEDILSTAFGGVAKMLTGKKFPQNYRALRLLTEELLRELIEGTTSHADLMLELEERSLSSRTTRLWVDSFLKPTFIMMLFVRAEREGDWSLHLSSVTQMLPYFFAAGHINYARYSLFYLRSMCRLPKEVLEPFMKGQHVMRHQPGIWNGMWSDMFIESTFMRYGHGPGGIIGITLKPNALNRWALSLHICSRMVHGLARMADYSVANVLKHKEEQPHRIKADQLDREKLRIQLAKTMHPIIPEQHPSVTELVNIVTGRVAPDSVNVDKALEIGHQQLRSYEQSLPEGFHNPISRTVKTMASMKKHIDIDNRQIYDTNLIYSRVLGLQGSRDISFSDILHYELSPVPTSMFHENGEIRICKAKSVLKNKIQVECSERNLVKPNAVVIDGCAALWVVHWPSSGTITDYANNFMSYLMAFLEKSDVYLAFDRYQKPTIKGQTRHAREGACASRYHALSAFTPLPPQKAVLNGSENKKQLINLVCQHLLKNHATFPKDYKMILTYEDPVPLEIHPNIIIQRRDMIITHEEADVIITNQVVQLAKAGSSSIKVVCDDTDVFVLLVYFYIKENLSCDLTMVGTSSGRTAVDIKATSVKHSDIACELLPAHVLSGCDTVSQLYGIGKGKVLKTLKSNYSLDKLGVLQEPIEEVINQATLFMTACYGCVDTDMTAARVKVWAAKLGNKRLTSAPPLMSLPPTSDSFQKHVYRAHYQAAIWRCSLTGEYSHPPPTEYGWSLDQKSQELDPVFVPP